eukprot:7379236-Prymnesium_polylepis.2
MPACTHKRPKPCCTAVTVIFFTSHVCARLTAPPAIDALWRRRIQSRATEAFTSPSRVRASAGSAGPAPALYQAQRSALSALKTSTGRPQTIPPRNARPARLFGALPAAGTPRLKRSTSPRATGATLRARSRRTGARRAAAGAPVAVASTREA